MAKESQACRELSRTVRELLQRFAGQEVDGNLLGLAGQVRLPAFHRIAPYRSSDGQVEVDALAEGDERWAVEVKWRGRLEGALVLNFALCTIRHDLEQLLDQLERQPVFEGISPREVYERGRYGAESPQGLSDQDVREIVEKSLRRLRRN